MAKFIQTFPNRPQGKPSDIKEDASVRPSTYLFDYMFVSSSIDYGFGDEREGAKGVQGEGVVEVKVEAAAKK